MAEFVPAETDASVMPVSSQVSVVGADDATGSPREQRHGEGGAFDVGDLPEDVGGVGVEDRVRGADQQKESVPMANDPRARTVTGRSQRGGGLAVGGGGRAARVVPPHVPVL